MVKTDKLTLQEIHSRNSDLAERLEASSLRVSYDEEFDIFMLTIGEPQPAITEEIVDGLQLRLEPDSLKLLGFEILRFKSRYLKANPEFAEHFAALFPKSPMQSRDIPKTPIQRKNARRAAGNLVPA